jgi:streptogrisin D
MARRTKVVVSVVGAVVVAVSALTLTSTHASSRRTGEAYGADAASRMQAATATLRDKAAIPGTAWAVDPGTDKLVVTADSTVTGARWQTLVSTVDSLGEGVAELKRAPGELRAFAEGGDPIFAGGGRCSLGFNVTTEDGRPGFLTAGHCVLAARQFSFSSRGGPEATVAESTFPGNGDFALVTYDDQEAEAPSEVDTGAGGAVQIRRAAQAGVGQQVSRMGSTTGLRDGRVTGLNATVNYPEGTVTGLIQTTVCAEPGDSGGPLFTREGDAIGLTSGGSGDCDNGGVTFFQPVTTALDAVGARIGDDNPGNDR